MYRIIDFVLERYKLIFVATLFLTLPFIYCYLNQNFVNAAESFFDNDDPHILRYKQFQEQFGNEESAVIALSGKSIVTVENILLIHEITQMTQSYKGIQRVKSLTNLERVTGYDDTVDFRRIVSPGIITEETVTKARSLITDSRPLQNKLISDDMSTSVILVGFEPSLSNNKKFMLLKEIRDKSERLASGNNVTLYFCGIPYVEARTTELIEEDIRFFTPVLFIMAFFLLIMVTGNISLVSLMLSSAAVITITGTGLLILCGETINSITVHIGIILFSFSVTGALHVACTYRENYFQNGFNHKYAVETASKYLWFPGLFTTIALSILYYSFSGAGIRPMKIVGIFAGTSLIHAFFITMIVLPSALMVFQKWIDTSPLKAETSVNLFFSHWAEYIKRIVIQHRSVIVFGFVIASGLFIYGITDLTYDTQFSRYLDNDSRIKKDTAFVEQKITGTANVELVLTALTQNDHFVNVDALSIVQSLQRDVHEHMGDYVTSVYSIADYMCEMHMAFNGGNHEFYALPVNPVEINDYYELGDDAVLKQLISPDRRQVRLSFRTRLSDTEMTKQFELFLASWMGNRFNDRYTYSVTGLHSLDVRLESGMKKSLIICFPVAVIFFIVVFFNISKKKSLLFFSVVATLFPVIAITGIMGFAGVPFYTSTFMTVAIALGMAADSTIRFLFYFRNNHRNVTVSMSRFFAGSGKTVLKSLVVTALFYFVFLFGSTPPAVCFGIFTGLSILFVIAGNLLVLPSLVLLFAGNSVGVENE